MLKTIAKALAAGITAIYKASKSVADDILQFALSPLRAVFGSGGGPAAPSFVPDIEAGELLDRLRTGPAKSADRRDQERNGVAVVTKYLQATPAQRMTMNLEVLTVDVRATLIGMDEHELHALRTAGPLAVRRFVDGKSHRVHGVPAVGPQPEPAPRERSTFEVMQDRIRERFDECRSTSFPAKFV